MFFALYLVLIAAAVPGTAGTDKSAASVPMVAVITAAIAAVPGTILALATLISSRSNNAEVKVMATQMTAKTDAVVKKADEIAEKTNVVTTRSEAINTKADTLIGHTEAIHKETNGAMTKLQAQLELSDARLDQSEKRNKELVESNQALMETLVKVMKLLETDDPLRTRLTAAAAVSKARADETDAPPPVVHTFDPKHPEETYRILTPKTEPTPPA